MFPNFEMECAVNCCINKKNKMREVDVWKILKASKSHTFYRWRSGDDSSEIGF